MVRAWRLALGTSALGLCLACVVMDGGGFEEDDAGAPLNNGGDPNAGGDCGDDDPLTNGGWVGFCADRVDDNCKVEDTTTPCATPTNTHNYCHTGDEPCPATQPGSAAPVWNCQGTPPDNVIAYGHYADPQNPNVVELCVFVYESEAVAGEHYVAYSFTDGASPFGQPNPPVSPAADCQADRAARRHLFLSDLDEGACDGVTFIHAYPNENPTGQLYPVDDQKLSNGCRKMVKNVSFGSPGFAPDIQFFAASKAEALGKLAILDTAEIACVGINNIQGSAYRPTERWYVQAAAPLTVIAE